MFVFTVLWTSLVLVEHIQGQCDVANQCYDCENSDEDIPNTYVCDGEEDCLYGDDETECDVYIECASGESIKSRWVCDGTMDCRTSGDDEVNCDHCNNTEVFYECPTSKLCLRISESVCDGYAHCEDGSDEVNCACDENHQFECSSGQCILNHLVCDGEEDCEDGLDEAYCGLTCSAEQFECLDHSSCVGLLVRCDGNEDCRDGSDEWYCVSLDPTTSAILVRYQGVNSPVCSSHWNEEWNNMTCMEMGLGSSSGNATTSLSSVSAYTANGFYLPEAADNPTSLLDLFGHSNECTEEAVTLTCDDNACGSRSQAVLTASRRKLLQGDDAKEGYWPWQVGLDIQGTPSCGGSLISQEWVLTAAHCVYDVSDASLLSVRLGTNLRYGPSEHLLQVNVVEFHMHKGYDNETLVNDVALLKLAKVVEYNDYVRPICLPTQGEIFPPEEFVECYTSGWGGLNDKSSNYPKRLQELKMGLVSDATCGADPDILHSLDPPTMICAGYNDDFATICSGDSGGPLVCRSRSTNTWTQAGVVSWGPGTDTIECMGYSVYAETSYYQNWIDSFNVVPFRTSLQGSVNTEDTTTDSTMDSTSDNYQGITPNVSGGELAKPISLLLFICGLLDFLWVD